MLKRVRYLNYSASYSYCPPVEDAVINTDHVVSATVCESRYGGTTMRVRFVDGKELTVVGEPKDLLGGVRRETDTTFLRACGIVPIRERTRRKP